MAIAVADSATAVQCMKQGAYDYITKPFQLDEVVLSVKRALEKRRLELENRDLPVVP
jgi:DNA-binding NtrC family response regulator